MLVLSIHVLVRRPRFSVYCLSLINLSLKKLKKTSHKKFQNKKL